MQRVGLSWLVFVILGGALGYLRYGDFLEPDELALMIKYGPYALLIVHIIIVVAAFNDSVFQGILCLLIPFYSFYYLFIVSDLFMLRAITGALIVGSGLDAYHFYHTVITQGSDRIQKWIESGAS